MMLKMGGKKTASKEGINLKELCIGTKMLIKLIELNIQTNEALSSNRFWYKTSLEIKKKIKWMEENIHELNMIHEGLQQDRVWVGGGSTVMKFPSIQLSLDLPTGCGYEKKEHK